jgi:hypothetical protein
VTPVADGLLPHDPQFNAKSRNTWTGLPPWARNAQVSGPLALAGRRPSSSGKLRAVRSWIGIDFESGLRTRLLPKSWDNLLTFKPAALALVDWPVPYV